MLYNESFKQGYIRYYLDTKYSDESEEVIIRNRNVLINFFNLSEPTERELKKDLYDFNKEDIKALYRSYNTTSFSRIYSMNYYYKMYLDYCIRIGARAMGSNANENPFELMDRTEITDCLVKSQTKIVTRERLLREMSILPNISDRFLCLALFEGICGRGYEELIFVKGSDFPGDGKVYLPTRTLTVSKELEEFAHKSASTYSYYEYTMDSGFNYSSPYKSDDGVGYCIKAMYNTTPTTDMDRLAQRIRSKLRRIKEFLGVEYTGMHPLLESGRLDLLKRLKREADPSVSYKRLIIEQNKGEVGERYGVILGIDNYLTRFREYLEMDSDSGG